MIMAEKPQITQMFADFLHAAACLERLERMVK